MNIWLVLLLGGLITFAIRFVLIYLLAEGRFEVPETMRKALHYVPPAVLSAFIFSDLFIREDVIRFSLDNHRLLAGVLAIVVAWFTRNTLITILTGMAALFLLQYFL